MPRSRRTNKPEFPDVPTYSRAADWFPIVSSVMKTRNLSAGAAINWLANSHQQGRLIGDASKRASLLSAYYAWRSASK